MSDDPYYPNYVIVSERGYKELQDAVNELIALGYRPTGGVCHTNVSSYMQAMVRSDL